MKIFKYFDKVNHDKKTAKEFLSGVLAVGAAGFILCLIWFGLLIARGIEWYWIAFDSAIVIFCIWAIVKAIVPTTKEIFDELNKPDEK